ncbi:methyltransferase [Candidatus Sumerlaeota bacterium]|nr:methyltransferase [Candidatus Sumerlaeota bacterium]
MPERGFRPSTDSRVLTRWTRVRDGERTADLGCGIGNIAVQLAAQRNIEMHGFELQEELVRIARRNVQNNRALLRGSVEIHQWDVRRGAPQKRRGQFDRVLCNPPWHRKGSGRLSPDPIRAAATHELEGAIADFLRCAAQLLRPGGSAHFILIAGRHEELLQCASEAGLRVASIKEIHTRSLDAPPKWRLYRLRDKAYVHGCRRLAPLLIASAQ